MPKYYDGQKLLSLKDINKETPEIFISTSNRSAGKTTYFGRKLVNDFIKKGTKFILVYRFAYEVYDAYEKFFSDIQRLFFSEYTMTQKMMEKDVFGALFLAKGDEEPQHCGYVISLNKADNIKKCSHLLSDAGVMLFDEFQSESGQYAPNEVQKFQSIHTSLARGGGQQVKYLPVIMISNFVSLLNPYYTALRISERLQDNTNYLRGEGWVLEQGFNDSASQAQKESAFNRAFGDNKYNKFSSDKFYLNDNNTFIKKMSGSNKYLFSLHFEGEWYGFRYYSDEGVVYVTKSHDKTHGRKYAVKPEDMTEETTLATTALVINFREAFDRGAFRFQNLECKAAAFGLLSY